MKCYTVAQLRKRLADVLNEAERGVPVVIERRGVRFVLKAQPAPARRQTRTSVIEIIDPAVTEGQWEWTWARKGLRFRPRRLLKQLENSEGLEI
jgi:antitoxin (DNA-binding transcriptional repressor) of toxin-antitoxin stability system